MKIKLEEGAIAPKRATNQSAGLDLYTWKDFIVKRGRQIIPTGVRIALDPGFEAHIRPRSGFSLKGMEGFPVSNGGQIGKTSKRYQADVIQGTLDADYTGIVNVIVKSDSDAPFLVKAGTRIAQMVIEQCYMGDFEEVDKLEDTERGEGGFNHTGTR